MALPPDPRPRFAWNSLRSKIGFIDFDDSFQEHLTNRPLSNFLAQSSVNNSDRSPTKIRKFSSIRISKVNSE